LGRTEQLPGDDLSRAAPQDHVALRLGEVAAFEERSRKSSARRLSNLSFSHSSLLKVVCA